MKYHVHVSTFGPLSFWVLAPNGTVVATFKNQTKADRCALVMNNSDWNKYVNN